MLFLLVALRRHFWFGLHRFELTRSEQEKLKHLGPTTARYAAYRQFPQPTPFHTIECGR